jgi:integrase
MGPQSSPRRRSRGRIERLPSDSLRVVVYAGVDPISKRRHYLHEVVPAGPRAAKEAEKVRTRLLAEVDDRRNPRTKATVRQLMERYLDVLTIEDTTRVGYERLVRLHIEPLLGDLSIGRIDGETLDSFYKELRTCRAHCRGRRFVEHRTATEHECDERCGPHRCKPLGGSSIRQIHNILNGAFTRAVRWRWIGTNPVKQAAPPSQPAPNPQPPTPAQAARLVEEAWADPDWGMFVWLAMTTGARRGELCALRWNRVDFVTGVLDIRSSIAQTGKRVWEKDTKTHQRRRIVLDPQTLALLQAYLQHCAQQAAALDLELAEDAFVFSSAPDGSASLKPDTVTQRYARLAARLGWDMHLHQLRHFSATELIAAGVDVRTVAGRLGHGGGGSTTLRVYSAWVAEADQRAADSLGSRLPALPAGRGFESHKEQDLPALSLDTTGPDSPYQRIAADLRAAIRCGALGVGEPLPTVKELSNRYGVSGGTAHRAVAVLTDAGLVVVARGRRAVVADVGHSSGPPSRR